MSLLHTNIPNPYISKHLNNHTLIMHTLGWRISEIWKRTVVYSIQIKHNQLHAWCQAQFFNVLLYIHFCIDYLSLIRAKKIMEFVMKKKCRCTLLLYDKHSLHHKHETHPCRRGLQQYNLGCFLMSRYVCEEDPWDITSYSQSSILQIRELTINTFLKKKKVNTIPQKMCFHFLYFHGGRCLNCIFI